MLVFLIHHEYKWMYSPFAPWEQFYHLPTHLSQVTGRYSQFTKHVTVIRIYGWRYLFDAWGVGIFILCHYLSHTACVPPIIQNGDNEMFLLEQWTGCPGGGGVLRLKEVLWMCRGIGSHFPPLLNEWPLPSQTLILVNQWVVFFLQKPIFAKFSKKSQKCYQKISKSGQIFDFW